MGITNTIGAHFVGEFMNQGMAFASGSIGPTYTCLNIFGCNASASSNWEDVWENGTTYTWPQQNGAVSIVSDSTADDQTSTGARTVIVEGLDGTFAQVSATLTITGLTTVTSSQLFRRINKIYVESFGAYDGTTISTHGNITATHLTKAAGKISTDTICYGKSNIARYTVPAGYAAYISQVDVNVDSTKQGGSVVMFARQNADDVTAPCTAKQIIERWDGVTGPYYHEFPAPLKFPAKTDIWFSCKASQAGTAIDVSFNVFLMPS